MLFLGATGLAIAFGSVPLPGDGSLAWEAPPQRCPDAAHVVELLQEHTGDARIGTRVQATAEAAEHEDGGWVVELSLRTDEVNATTRSFRVESCEAGAQAVALALAIAMSSEASAEIEPEIDDPAAPGVVAPPQPAPEDSAADVAPLADRDTEPSPTAVPAPGPADGAQPEVSSTRDAPRVRAVIGMAGGVTAGLLPRVSGLLSAYGGAIGPRWRAVVHVQHEIRHEFSLPTRPDGSGRVSLYGAALEAGPVFRPGPIEIPLTAGIAAAGLRAQGEGATRNHTRTVPWLGFFAATGLTWAPVPRFAFGVRGELVASLLRHTFAFAPSFPLVATGWVGGRGLAVLEVRVP